MPKEGALGGSTMDCIQVQETGTQWNRPFQIEPFIQNLKHANQGPLSELYVGAAMSLSRV